MTDPADNAAIVDAIDAEAMRTWPNDRAGARRFRRYAWRALSVLEKAGFALQPMPPRRPWPHEEVHFAIWRQTETFPDTTALKAHLDSLTDDERQKVEVRAGWRNESGDYVHSLLTLQETWEAECQTQTS